MANQQKLAINGGSPVRTEPFAGYPVYDSAEEAAVLRVVRSNILCAEAGNEVKAFEEKYASYHGSTHGIAVMNGTISLHIALAAAGIGPGDEVIVPPLTWISTASAVVMQNAIPVFADIEPCSLGLDPAEVSKKITSNTKAIIVVHMNGYPADMDGLMAVAKTHNLLVIEDCSHAHGAEYHGKKVGTIGDIGSFSFQHKKNMSLGEGGIAITDNAILAEKMRNIRTFGNAPMIYNYRMPELHGAIGEVRLEKLRAMNEIRWQNAAILDHELQGIAKLGLTPQTVREDCVGVYYNYNFCYSAAVTGVARDKFIQAVGIEGIPLHLGYTVPVHQQNLFTNQDAYGHGCPFACPLYGKTVDYTQESYPVAENCCSKTNIQVKIQPPNNANDMRDIANGIRKVLENINELKNN